MKTYLTFYSIICMLFSSSSNSNDGSSGPTANDDSLTVNENSGSGEANQIDVSKNDNIGSNGGDSNNYSLVNTPSNRNVSEVSDGVFEYIPNAGYFGSDSFTHKNSFLMTTATYMKRLAFRRENLSNRYNLH